MKYTSERLPDSQVLLRIEVDAERAAKSIDQAYRKLSNRLAIPGFRKGKTPRHVIERMVGHDALVQEGIDLLFPAVFKEAIAETGIQPIAEPHVDVVQQDPLVMNVTVPVRPTVELGDYTEVRAEPDHVYVSNADVDAALEQLREQHAEWIPVERPVAANDRVTMDITAHIRGAPVLYSPKGEALMETPTGEPIIDQKGAEYTVDLESRAPVMGFAEKVVGQKADEESRFEITFPSDYPDRKLANKTVIFQVRVKAIKEKRLSDLDDEFAKSAGDFETLEALRQSVSDNLRQQKEREAQKRLADRVLSTVTDQARMELPEALLEREIERLGERMERQLQQARLSMDEYLRSSNKTKEDLRADYRVDAIANLRRYLVLEEVAKLENVQVSEADVEAEIKKIEQVFGEYGEKATANLRKPEGREDLAEDLRRRRAMERLVEIAVGKATAGPASEQSAEALDATESEAE